jgi:uncharacterized protein
VRARRLQRLPRRELPGGLILYEARSRTARLLGLARLRALPSGSALLIPRCRSVHTFGMRFAIDVVFVDDIGRPLRIVRALAPRRLAGWRVASSVLETNAGEADRFVTALALVSRPRRRAP